MASRRQRTYLKLFAGLKGVSQRIINELRNAVHWWQLGRTITRSLRIAWFAITASVRRTQFEWSESILQDGSVFLPSGSLALVRGPGATLAEASVNFGQAGFSYVARQQRRGMRRRVYPPLCKEFMIHGVFSRQFRPAFGPKEVAELCTSGYDFTELEIDCVWHDDGFFLHHLGQAQQVPDRDFIETFEFPGAMAHQPGDNCPGVFLVLNVEVE